MIRAIILAAGQGTRLRPYTDEIPKTMVKLNGKAILDYQRETFNACGVYELNVVVGYKKEKIDENKFIKHINPRFDETNMVYSLHCAKHLFDGNADIIISYGDIIFDQEVSEKLIKDAGNTVSIIFDLDWYDLWKLRMDDPLQDAESFKIDTNGNVTELGKKVYDAEEVQGQYTGLIYVSAAYASGFFDLYVSLAGTDQLFDGKDYDNMYMTSYLQMLIDAGIPLKGVPIHNGWLEIDTVDDLQMYESMIKQNTLKEFCKLPS